MNKQPEALRLADLFEFESVQDSLYRKAAAELRRLHAENEKLSAAMGQQEPVAWLSEVYEGGHVNLEVVWRGDFGAFPVFRRQQHCHTPLTDEQILELYCDWHEKPGGCYGFARAIETHHGIK